MARTFTDAERRILAIVQQDLPDTLTPFADIAKAAGPGVTEDMVIDLLSRLKEEGVIRRFGASIKHQRAGWSANAMIGLQQTLPADFKLSVYAMTSTKNYTLQGWSGGFNLITANISKSLLKDKLNLSLMGMMGLNKGGNINIESHSQGKDFTSHTLTKVPLYGFTFTVSYTFGNSKRQAQQHTSRIQNDYIEQQSQGEMINSVGNVQ